MKKKPSRFTAKRSRNSCSLYTSWTNTVTTNFRNYASIPSGWIIVKVGSLLLFQWKELSLRDHQPPNQPSGEAYSEVMFLWYVSISGFLSTPTYNPPKQIIILKMWISTTPPKFIPKMAMFERSYLFQTVILGIHVSFRGCNYSPKQLHHPPFFRSQESATQKPSCWWHWECRCKRSRLTWGPRHGSAGAGETTVGWGGKEGWWVNVWWKNPTKQERISWQWEVFKWVFFCSISILAHPKKGRVVEW